VVAAHALPLKLSVLLAAAVGIGTGMVFEVRDK
jgi:predicted outer membrane lipoprotein